MDYLTKLFHAKEINITISQNDHVTVIANDDYFKHVFDLIQNTTKR